MVVILLLTIWSFCVVSGLTTDHSMSSSPVSKGLGVYLQPKVTLSPSAFRIVLGPVDVTCIPRTDFNSKWNQTRLLINHWHISCFFIIPFCNPQGYKIKYSNILFQQNLPPPPFLWINIISDSFFKACLSAFDLRQTEANRTISSGSTIS